MASMNSIKCISQYLAHQERCSQLQLVTPRTAIRSDEDYWRSWNKEAKTSEQGKNVKEHSEDEGWPRQGERKMNPHVPAPGAKMVLLALGFLKMPLWNETHFDVPVLQNYFLVYMFILKLNTSKMVIVIIAKSRSRNIQQNHVT